MVVIVGWWLVYVMVLPFAIVSSRNTLLIVADDAGTDSIGAYGNPVIRTPHIDKLARDGTKFNNALASVSSCSPSRSVILTGRPCHQNGMYGLHHDVHHFSSFDSKKLGVVSVSKRLINRRVYTGIIGKKHVGPETVYPFDFAHTEENSSINQVGRNITRIKNLVQEFFNAIPDGKDFFLYVAFHDPHRCGHTNPEFGDFCEKFGNGEPGMGSIPDWNPSYYNPHQVQVPFHVPDTAAAREDIAKQYTTISRLDQGVGLLMKVLSERQLLSDTLVIFSSDNGIPFPVGRTNLYEPGIREPLILRKPNDVPREVDGLVSLVDIVPTILEWHNVEIPSGLSGESLLQSGNGGSEGRKVYGSQSFHEVTMTYPMRFVRTDRFKLIHNINYQLPFPIDQDFYLSSTFQDILSRTRKNETTHWYKSLDNYYQRKEWELFDLKADPEERYNTANKDSYQTIFRRLKEDLFEWQNRTGDPWLCSPGSVLENKGIYKHRPSCLSLR